jgi:hypothetical protein
MVPVMAASSEPPRARQWGLTGRSTGHATAWHPGRAAAFVYHRPHGQGAIPRRAG